MAASAADYEEMSEPNMKLSRALLIVLLLHVVAVAGIIAFNAIKSRQGSIPALTAPPANAASAIASSRTKQPSSSLPTASAQKGNGKTIAKDGNKPERKQSDSAKAVTDSGKIYVVAKGDNPVTIAKKFKVPYDDLIALNHIDDPRKLQIGQKLLIPTKTEKPKKSAE